MPKPIEFDGKSLLPNAIPAPQLQLTGKNWEPDLHFAGALADTAEISFVCNLLKKYANDIAAYYLFPDCNDPNPVGALFPGMFSVELRFAETPAGREALEQCRKQYKTGKGKRQPLGFDETPVHKRLFRNRFYRLPDGQDFLYLGKWDRRTVWGKVLSQWNGDGTCQLANKIVPREVLQRCKLTPQDEEPFALSSEPPP